MVSSHESGDRLLRAAFCLPPGVGHPGVPRDTYFPIAVAITSTTIVAGMTSTEPSNTFSAVYFSSQSGEDGEKDNNDFRAGSSFVDVSSVPHVDTIDNSTPHSAISPVARKILLDDDSDEDIDCESGSMTSLREVELPVSEFEDEESRSRNNNGNQHSLPNVEDYKISVAVASAEESSSSSFLSSSTMVKIVYPAMFFILVVLIIILFTIGAIVGIENRKSSKQTIIFVPNERHYDDRMTHLQNYMVKYGVSSPDNFFNGGSSEINSPQSQAIRWLANEDRQLPILPTHEQDLTTEEGYTLVTRYAVAVFYFATNGKNWDSSYNFLDPDKATCDWFQIFQPPKGELGVLCNQTTRRIIGLSLSK